jgi:hypothetical protein
VTVALALSSSGQEWSGDLVIYRYYASSLMSGHLTQTAFLDWYPALSLIPLTLPLLPFGGQAQLPEYALVFALLMAMLAAATANIGSSISSRWDPDRGSVRSYFVCAVLLLLAASVVVFRYDIVPAFAAGAGIYAVIAGWPLMAGIALGISAGLKIYALVIVLVAMIWFWSGRDWNALLRFVCGGAIAAVLSLLPYAFLTPSNPLAPIAFNMGRPLQIESVGGGLVSLLTLGSPLPVTFDYGSFNFVSDLAQSVARTLSPLQLLLVGSSLMLVAWAFVRDRRRSGHRSQRRLAVGVTVPVLALTLTSRVLSPQYLLWLLPFIAVLAADSRRLFSLATGVFALTLLIFPIGYGALISQHPVAVAVLNVRNGLLIVLWVALTWELIRSPHPAIVSQSTRVEGRRSPAATQLRPKSTVGP